MKFLLASNNADVVATVVVIVAAVVIMSLVILGLALALFYASKKNQETQKTAQAKKTATQAKQPAAAQKQQAQPAGARKPAFPIIPFRQMFAYLFGDSEQFLLPAPVEPLMLGGGAQLAIAQYAERLEEPGLTLKESIALAVAAESKHLNINKKTVAAWLTENYGDEILLNRRANRTKTGLPLADTHYLKYKNQKKCFIYVYDLSKEKSMLLLRADDKTAWEIIGEYPSIRKSLFPKSTTEQWYTLVPDMGFETEQQIYDIIELIISRLRFMENEETQPVEEIVELEDDMDDFYKQLEEPAEEEVVEPEPEPEEEGLTLKESIELAVAAESRHLHINKQTIADWITEYYGDAIILNRRENRTKTGLPLADTHYINRKGKKKCFIYVYELAEDKSMLLFRADDKTAWEIVGQYPSVHKSRFPKTSNEQWYTLIPDIGFESEREVYDVLALVIERLAFNNADKHITARVEEPVQEVQQPVEEPVTEIVEQPEEKVEEQPEEPVETEAEAEAAVAEAEEEIAAAEVVAEEEDEEEDIEEEDEELPPEQVDEEVAARGITLKESIALATAMAQTKINKQTVAVWLTKKYGDEIVLNRRENRIKTGLPLADTHYVKRNGKNKCFIYVYELNNNKSFLLLKTDGITAAEIAEKDPLFIKSRFPKSKYNQWYTLVPDVCYKNAKEVFDVIELVLSRFLEKDESKVLYEKVYAKRKGHRKPGKKFAVNCDTLAQNYKAGETVNMKNLKEKGLVPKSAKQIKILARGAIKKPLTVIADDFSADAVLFISKVGGTPILTD